MKSRLFLIITAVLVLVIGSAVNAATVAQATSAIDGTGNRTGESALGDLVADAVRASGGAEIGFVSASLLNDVNIPAGPVSDQALTSALPFPDDAIAVLSLKGTQIRQAMERSLELYPKGNSAFLQISGMSVRFDPNRTLGSRVRSVRVSGADLDPQRTYQVAMPISLGRGSLGYFRIWTKDNILRTTDTKLSAVVIDYARGQKTIAYTPGERITARPNE